MELRQLDIFRILAHELNFTRAAQRANCVQSNVSVQIRALEDELRVPLFERLGQQVRLTVHGKRLLPYAERILRLVEEAGVVAAGSEKPAGTLIVGSPESVLTYRLPRILQAFRAEFPDVDLVFRAVSSAELNSI
jgi:DNA-binding transcriptional LysR family regulator